MFNKKDNSRELEKIIAKMKRVDNIKQLPQDATLAQVIDAINKITNSTKSRTK